MNPNLSQILTNGPRLPPLPRTLHKELYLHRLLRPMVNLCTLPLFHPLHTYNLPPSLLTLFLRLLQQHTTTLPYTLLTPHTPFLRHTTPGILPHLRWHVEPRAQGFYPLYVHSMRQRRRQSSVHLCPLFRTSFPSRQANASSSSNSMTMAGTYARM